MSGVNGGRRAYRSPLREEGARRTRRLVTEAAAELFTTRGYAATSLADVAARAGVARPTVFATFGSKAALLRQVLDQALAGDDEPVAVAERPWFRPVWDAGTADELLDAYAEVCMLIGRRAAPVFEVVRRAADTAPEVAELWAQTDRNRLAGARMVVDRLAAVGRLREGVGADRAVDRLWLLNDPGHVAALVGQRGWTADEYRTWLAGQMRASLLAP